MFQHNFEQNEREKCSYRMIKLSKDFIKHCSNDLAKKSIYYSWAVLQGLCVWPDSTSNVIKRWIVITCIISLGLMELAHIVYVMLNITQISKMASACTTVSTTFETMVKLGTVLYYRESLNRILSRIWKDFWPANIASKRRQRIINIRSIYITYVSGTFLFMAYISCAQFMAFPLISTTTNQLPLASWYPFNFYASPVYEMLYIWQWFMNQIVICTLSGFDAFFNAIVMICACQFQVIQEVLETMCEDPLTAHWAVLFDKEIREQRKITEYDVLIKCVKHHRKLIDICKEVEKTFTHIVFLQFVLSTMAICVSCVALIADPSLFEHMLSYCIAHLLQFFIYCSVGNELTHQSGMLADAAYNCDWEKSTDLNFRRGLVMIIQRAQRPEALTVAGLMQLSFANFVASVQLSFSFYTLLNSFV